MVEGGEGGVGGEWGGGQRQDVVIDMRMYDPQLYRDSTC